MPKTVLIVTYGGGHARMCIPAIRALEGSGVNVVSLALTTGGPIFASEGLPYLGFKDFLTPQDTRARARGEELAAAHHTPDSGISLEETVAYHGLCYQDLVQRHGEAEAARLWREQGRHAFRPITVLERVFDRVKPDLVVTTNSPKSERAAVDVANQRGIPSLALVDLFGIHHFHALEARYIAVLCEHTVGNMQEEGVKLPREAFFVTGNPAFDRAFDYRGPLDGAWRKEHFPQLPSGAKVLLWIDMPAYWDLKLRALHTRTDAEILQDLDDMEAAAVAARGYLFVRPHPSQPRAIYQRWMAQKPRPQVRMAADMPLYPLLKAVDAVATYTSTVSVEALLMERQVIQLKYAEGRSDMPLGEWGLAWLAQQPSDLPRLVNSAFYDEAEKTAKLARAAKLLPQSKAGPSVARLIQDLLSR